MNAFLLLDLTINKCNYNLQVATKLLPVSYELVEREK